VSINNPWLPDLGFLQGYPYMKLSQERNKGIGAVVSSHAENVSKARATTEFFIFLTIRR